MSSSERRRVQRVHPVRPLPGTLNGQKIYVVDLSLRGLSIVHQEWLGIEEEVCGVSFDWNGQPVTLQCKVTRTVSQPAAKPGGKPLLRSGLQIVGSTVESAVLLQAIVADQVSRALDEQRANARGIPAIAAQSYQSGKGTRYVRHELYGDTWRTTPTTDSRQPINGFTVSAEQTTEEVTMLRDVWRAGDESTRAMLRTMSAMSISNAEGIPTRRYMP
jgi:hypothetical protein